MRLYDIKNGKIHIYNLIPDPIKISKYKEEEMQKIPEGERVLKAITNGVKVFEGKRDTYYHTDVNYRYNCIPNGTDIHELTTYEMSENEKTKQQELLNNYYNGNLKGKRIIKIEDYNEDTGKYEILKYLLLTTWFYRNEYLYGNTYTMHDIISIPRSLYLLYLLEEGGIKSIYEVYDKDISEQLKVFNISKDPIEISLEEIEKVDKMGLLPGIAEGIKQDIRITQKILQQKLK